MTFPVVYINCSRHPFIDDIMNNLKTRETRTRNMLRQLIGIPVYLAETGNGKPVIRCMVSFGAPEKVETVERWNELRNVTRIPVGSKYDWTPETK